MPSAPKQKKRWAGEILAGLLKQKLSKQSEGTPANLLESTLEIARLLEVMVENIDTLVNKQYWRDLPTAPTEVYGLPAKAAPLSEDATDHVGHIVKHNDVSMGPGGESHGINCHWDNVGVRRCLHWATIASVSQTATAGCNHVVIGKARMWILGQQDIIDADLSELSEHTIIVNCKNERVPAIDQVCQRRAAAITVLDPMNIGYAPGRWQRFEHALQMSIRAVNLGGDVVVHCKSGVHRAALAFALNLMFLQADTSFEDACKQLQEIRPQVDLPSIINPQPRHDGRFSEDMNPWIRDCEKHSTKEQYYRQVHPMIHTSQGPLGAVAIGGTRYTELCM